MRKVKAFLEVVATLSVIATCGVIMWSILKSAPAGVSAAGSGPSPAPVPTRAGAGPREAPLPTAPLRIEPHMSLGSSTAEIAMLIFSDFQCPYCASFASNTLPKIRAEYVDSGKMRIGFHHFPLEGIHAQAVGAAEAAECAGRQGRFWEMHDGLFVDIRALGPESYRRNAERAGLNMGDFEACVKGDVEAKIRRDQQVAAGLGVAGTPTMMLGRVDGDQLTVSTRIYGAQPIERIRDAIESVLKAG